MTKQRLIISAVTILALSISYVVGWHTSFGRAIRGVSSVSVVNRSGAPVEHLTLQLSDGRGRQIERYFPNLSPGRTASVRIRTSDLIVRRIFWKQGKDMFSYDESANVTPGEIFSLAVDLDGKVSSGYKEPSRSVTRH